MGNLLRSQNWEGAYQIAEAMAKAVPEDPFGLCSMGIVLHQMGKTQEALGVDVEAAKKFPDHYLIAYNLASYACQLGQLEEALIFLEQAFENHKKQKIPGEDLRLIALEDPNLEPLWGKIGNL
jgi:tetratricopeptide (TPR) repeat protein